MAEQQQRQISPQERALLFSQSTRQNLQMLPSQRVAGENSTVQFTLPKVRLLSRILLEVEATAILTSTAGDMQVNRFGPYNILRRISLDLNNGFSPFIINGQELYLYNLVNDNSDVFNRGIVPKGTTYVEHTPTTAGNPNRIKFMLSLPVALNERDSVGLVLLQNEETQVTLTIDIDSLANAYTLNAGTGDTVTFSDMKISPCLETFSIPPLKEAFPDISILKLVSAKRDVYSGAGSNVVKLPVGTIYRKLILNFEKEDGTPLRDDDFNGNIELVFNQADIPYSIKPSILSAVNHKQFGQVLPEGCYVFDFSYQGLSNYGGSRDYIDTERLTEFWIRFNTAEAGRVTAVTENLSRLRTE